MFGLAEIRKMNRLASRPKPEDNHSRHCSFTGGESGGIVLHSAKLRNTVFIKGKQAIQFLHRVDGCEDQDHLDFLIESYFE